MPEPFSVAISAIGLTMTILGFFASTLSTLADKHREYIDADIRLSNYRHLLQTCSMKFDTWSEQWLGDIREPRYEMDCILFWGRRDYQGIFARLKDIEAMLKDLENRISKMDSIESKLLFAFIKSAAFRDRIERLGKMIDDLITASNIAFERLHPGGQTADDSLAKLLCLRDGRLDFCSWINRLDEQRNQIGTLPSDQWSLVLKVPTEEGGIIPDESDISVEFLVEGNRQGKSNHQIVTHVYSFQSSQISQVDIHRRCFELSRQPFKASSLTPVVWNSLRNERTQAALGLATWTFPLVGTAWARNICTCIVDHAIIDKSVRTSVLSRRQQEKCEIHQHNVEHLEQHTFLLLGMTLAELILDNLPSFCVSTRADIRNEPEAWFEMEREKNGTFTKEILSEGRLLSEIGEKSRGYKEVVKNCFDLDRRISLNAGYSVQDTNQWVNKVLKPLRDYSHIITKHSQRILLSQQELPREQGFGMYIGTSNIPRRMRRQSRQTDLRSHFSQT